MRSSHIHVRFGSVLHAEASEGTGKRKRNPTPGRARCVSCMTGDWVSECQREITKSRSLALHFESWIAFWSICASVFLLSCGPLSSGRTQDLICCCCYFFPSPFVCFYLFISSSDFRSKLLGVELASKQIGPPGISLHNLPFTDPRNHTVWLLSNQLTVAQTVDAVWAWEEEMVVEVAGGVMIACSGVARALFLHSGCHNEKQSKDNNGQGWKSVTCPASRAGGNLCGVRWWWWYHGWYRWLNTVHQSHQQTFPNHVVHTGGQECTAAFLVVPVRMTPLWTLLPFF